MYPVTDRLPAGVTITTTPATCEGKGSIVFTTTPNDRGLYSYNFNHLGFSLNTTYEDLLPGNYPVSIYSAENNYYSDTILEVQGEHNLIYAANSFTGSGDMYMQLWKIYGTCIDTMDCRIYNRWGELMKVLNDPEEGWDGTYMDKPVPQSVYTWFLSVTFLSGESREIRGTVIVLR